MGLINQIISTVTNALNPEITLRDYQHAAKTFESNNYSNLPKSKRFFHIFFQINPNVIDVINKSLSQASSSGAINWNPQNVPILGVLAKSVRLPNFKFEVKKNNQYNKWNLNINKINYEPIEVAFWDDTVSQINGFWYAYYQYMIQDPNYVNWSANQQQGIPIPKQWQQSNANTSTLYSSSSNWNNYGMDTANATSSFGRVNSFFDSIRIYQFNRALNPQQGAEYNEYVLVNPIISGFNHDQLEYSSTDFMTNTMTIEYETVLYNSGLVNNDEIASWDAVRQRFFDNTPSPLGTSPISQILNGVENIINSITNPGSSTGLSSVTTILPTTTGSQSSVNSSATNSITNTQIDSPISVPYVSGNYGTGGGPPEFV